MDRGDNLPIRIRQEERDAIGNGNSKPQLRSRRNKRVRLVVPPGSINDACGSRVPLSRYCQAIWANPEKLRHPTHPVETIVVGQANHVVTMRVLILTRAEAKTHTRYASEKRRFYHRGF